MLIYIHIYIIIHIQKSWVKWIWEMMNYQPWYLLSTQTCGKGEHETTNPVSHPFSAHHPTAPAKLQAEADECTKKDRWRLRHGWCPKDSMKIRSSKSHRLIDPGKFISTDHHFWLTSSLLTAVDLLTDVLDHRRAFHAFPLERLPGGSLVIKNVHCWTCLHHYDSLCYILKKLEYVKQSTYLVALRWTPLLNTCI